VKGFTLIELLVVITIVAISLLFAIPAFHSFITSNRTLTQVNQLVAAINFARSEAIKRHTTITLCGSMDGHTCIDQWQKGWLVRIDKDNKVLRNYGAIPARDQLVWRSSLAKSYLQMNPLGNTRGQDGRFIYCPATKNTQQFMAVIISQSGRVRIARNDGSEGKLFDCS